MDGGRGPLWKRYRHLAPNVAFVCVVAAVAIFVVSVSWGNGDAPDTSSTVVETEIPDRQTAAGTAVRVLLYVSSGNIAAAIPLYDFRVKHAFGEDAMAKALTSRRVGLRGQSIRVALQDPAPGGRLVILASRGPQGSADYAFTLRSTATGWRVVYDSFFGDALAERARMAATQRLEPDVATPSPRTQRLAQREADRASKRYRRLLIPD